MDEPLQGSGQTQSPDPGKVSYAEVEEFCYGIRRRYALSSGEITLSYHCRPDEAVEGESTPAGPV